MRRPPVPIFVLCLAAVATCAVHLSSVARTTSDTMAAAGMMAADSGRVVATPVSIDSGALRSSTAAAAMADDPSSDPPAASVTRALADLSLSMSDDATARLLEAEGPGTYIDELLRADGAALTRWPAGGETSVSYWIQPGAGLADYTPENRRRVAEAFDAWEHSGIPLHFAVTTDSALADIVVLWTPHFTESISGKTRWMHDRHGWIRGARITLALHRYTGERLSSDALHAIALHEVGHSLGMDHTADVANVMAPRVRVRALSDADRATARLLYRLPPGLRR